MLFSQVYLILLNVFSLSSFQLFSLTTFKNHSYCFFLSSLFSIAIVSSRYLLQSQCQTVHLTISHCLNLRYLSNACDFLCHQIQPYFPTIFSSFHQYVPGYVLKNLMNYHLHCHKIPHYFLQLSPCKLLPLHLNLINEFSCLSSSKEPKN